MASLLPRPATVRPVTPTSLASGTTQRADRVRDAFAVIAFAEAVSWAGLLTSMLFKYVISDDETGVQVFGPIHGVIFLTYVVACLVARSRFGWGLGTTALALAASIPPFCTAIFEVWAARTDRLRVRSLTG